MNRRGELSLRVIYVIIALFVLFILFYGGKYITKEGGIFDKLIPGFGIEKKIPDDVKIIRYDIAKDSLSYYDGVKFIALDYKKDEAFGFDYGSIFAFNSQTKNAYILDIIDEIYFAVYSIKKSSGDSIVYESVTKIKEGSILYPSLIKWRDYVLTKPIEIEIEGGENVYVCVEKIGGFLSLDLDEGVDSEYECSNS